MKQWIAAVLLLALAVCSYAADPAVGDSRAVVLRSLGKPVGRVALGDKEILNYPRGLVELRGDRVTVVKLISVEELNRLNRERAAAEAADRERQAARQNEMAEARKKLLSDDSLMTNAAAWAEFQARYPDAQIPDEQRQIMEAGRAAPAPPPPPEIVEEKEKPRLSASKRRRYIRAGDTNMVDIASHDDTP